MFVMEILKKIVIGANVCKYILHELRLRSYASLYCTRQILYYTVLYYTYTTISHSMLSIVCRLNGSALQLERVGCRRCPHQLLHQTPAALSPNALVPGGKQCVGMKLATHIPLLGMRQARLRRGRRELQKLPTLGWTYLNGARRGVSRSDSQGGHAL